jgi:DNA-directed RNA polymerase subunit RPC12/RpoP
MIRGSGYLKGSEQMKVRKRKRSNIPDVEVAHYSRYPVINCPYCHRHWIHMAVFRAGQGGYHVYPKQVITKYCPYCGAKMPELAD